MRTLADTEMENVLAPGSRSSRPPSTHYTDTILFPRGRYLGPPMENRRFLKNRDIQQGPDHYGRIRMEPEDRYEAPYHERLRYLSPHQALTFLAGGQHTKWLRLPSQEETAASGKSGSRCSSAAAATELH